MLVPSLEARLMNESTSEQDVRHIADLVSLLLIGVALVNFDPSYRRGPTAVDRMILRA
jgi:hypothetical protein